MTNTDEVYVTEQGLEDMKNELEKQINGYGWKIGYEIIEYNA